MTSDHYLKHESTGNVKAVTPFSIKWIKQNKCNLTATTAFDAYLVACRCQNIKTEIRRLTQSFTKKG